MTSTLRSSSSALRRRSGTFKNQSFNPPGAYPDSLYDTPSDDSCSVSSNSSSNKPRTMSDASTKFQSQEPISVSAAPQAAETSPPTCVGRSTFRGPVSTLRRADSSHTAHPAIPTSISGPHSVGDTSASRSHSKAKSRFRSAVGRGWEKVGKKWGCVTKTSGRVPGTTSSRFTGFLRSGGLWRSKQKSSTVTPFWGTGTGVQSSSPGTDATSTAPRPFSSSRQPTLSTDLSRKTTGRSRFRRTAGKMTGRCKEMGQKFAHPFRSKKPGTDSRMLDWKVEQSRAEAHFGLKLPKDAGHILGRSQ